VTIEFTDTGEYHRFRRHVDSLSVSYDAIALRKGHTIAKVSVANRTLTTPFENRISTTSGLDQWRSRKRESGRTLDKRKETTVMDSDTSTE